MTGNRKYIGECIYCGSKDSLQDEHCIPQSFDGAAVLEHASCPKCAKRTGRFEERFTRGTALGFRTVLNMRSKRPKKRRPATFPIRFGRNGVFTVEEVPVSEYIPVLPLPELGPPEVLAKDIIHPLRLRGRQYRIEEYRLDHQRGAIEQKLLKKYAADEAFVDWQLHVGDFLRLLAKIAFCHSVLRYGLRHFEEIFIRDAILKGGMAVWKWVGSDGRRFIYATQENFDSTHIIACGRHDGTEVRCRIKLLNKSPTPEYIVVVGKLSDHAAAIFDSLGHR